MCQIRHRCRAALIFLAVVVLIITILVVIFQSFSTLEYYEYGFKKHTTKGSLDRSKVYGPGGWYVTGPEYCFLPLHADAQHVHFHDVQVFAKDRLEVRVSAEMQYFLRKDQMHLLHRKFDIDFSPIIKSNALSSLKNKAPSFHTREFIRNRSLVEEELFYAIREKISGPCCEANCVELRSCVRGCRDMAQCMEDDFGFFVDVRYFQLGAIELPSGLKAKFLKTQVLYEEANIETFQQEASLVRKQTYLEAKKIENEGKVIRWEANANSTLIKSQADANATAVVEHARAAGLQHLYSEMAFTDPKHKTSFDYLRTLTKHNNVNLAVNFQQLIAGKL